MKFSCHGCGQHIDCDESAQGQRIDCPSCGFELIVPSSFGPPTAPPDVLAQKRRKPFPTGVLITVATLVIVIAAGTLIIMKLLRDRDTQGGPANFVMGGEAVVNQMPGNEPAPSVAPNTPTMITPTATSGFSADKAYWPQWRGPNRDGISPETGLLDSWPTEGPPLAWRMQGLGGGFSSVSIAEGRLFTMGRPNNEDELIAVNLANRQILWQARLGRGNNEGPRCTPTLDGNRVYGLSTEGRLLCADTASGREIWKADYKGGFGGQMMSDWGYCESPLIDGDKLICVPGGDRSTVVALDKMTGRPIWRCDVPDMNAGRRGAAYTGAVISEGAGIRQYVVLLGQGVVGISAEGQFLWGYNRIANPTANVPTPLVSGDYVFASTGYGTGAALLQLVRSGNRVQARETYFLESNRFQNHHGNMVLVDGHIYAGHGHDNGLPICLDLRTGRAKWGPERGAGRQSAAIIYADGHLYFRYQNAVMALIEATPESYKLKGSFQIAANNGQSWSHPVIADGHLYLRDQHELLCYDIRK